MKNNDSKRLLMSNRIKLRHIEYGTPISFEYDNEIIRGRLMNSSINDHFTIAQVIDRGERKFNEKITYKYHLAKNISVH